MWGWGAGEGKRTREPRPGRMTGIDEGLGLREGGERPGNGPNESMLGGNVPNSQPPATRRRLDLRFGSAALVARLFSFHTLYPPEPR